MGRGHAHALYVHEHSVVHGIAPEAKLAAALGSIGAVAVTPREAVWAFAAYAVIVLTLTVISNVSIRFLSIRLLGVAPFVAFAFLIPFIATGEQVRMVGVEVSVQGLWGAWNILAKAVLGASISILVAATTEVAEIIRAFGVLRIPTVFTSIALFMIRYLELVADELGRMRLAMESRGYDPRWLSQARPIASGAGALFVRSYERGERVHAAMVSRGFDGTMPSLGRATATSRDWSLGLVVAAMFVSIAVIAMVSE